MASKRTRSKHQLPKEVTPKEIISEQAINTMIWLEKIQPDLIARFKGNETAFYTYICALLNLFIYTNTTLLWASNKLFQSDTYLESMLGPVNLTEPMELLYSRVGQTLLYSLPNKENNTLCTISHDNHTIYVTFRGTTNFSESIRDLQICKSTFEEGICNADDEKQCLEQKNLLEEPCTWSEEKCVDLRGTADVHCGFQKHLQYIKESTSGTPDTLDVNSDSEFPLGTKDPIRMLYEVAKISRHKNKNIVISGHSLGGSTAVLFASQIAILAKKYTLVKKVYDRIVCIPLYGCPGIGNEYFQTFFNKEYAGKCFNCVYGSDFVSWLSLNVPGINLLPVGKYIALSDSDDTLEIQKEMLSCGSSDKCSFLHAAVRKLKAVHSHSPHNYIWAIYNGVFDEV